MHDRMADNLTSQTPSDITQYQCGGGTTYSVPIVTWKCKVRIIWDKIQVNLRTQSNLMVKITKE